MKQVGKWLKAYGIMLVGAVIYALGFNWFYEPNGIAFGGLTGIAQIVNAVLPAVPIGVLVIVMNIPLFLLGWRLLGGKLLVTSLYAMAVSSLAIDAIAALHPRFEPMEPLLACIYGGVMMGVGLGLIFLQGATTGGTDLMARLLKLKLQWLPMGKVLLLIDLVVIVAVAAAFRSLDSALYGLVALYLSTKVMDLVLYGLDTAKVAYIISDRAEDITRDIVELLDRGVTVLHGRGGYSGQEKRVLMCAFKQRQIVELKRVVKERDPDAFLIVCDAHEVLGDGFGAYHANSL